MTAKRIQNRIGCLLVLIVLSAGTAFPQTQVRPGFNLFSVEQDQEIGRQSAAEVERQLPILRDRSVEEYVNAVGKRLAAAAPGAGYPYQFKVVNASDINAFALPGGYMYLNRGLIEAAGSEGQLAGVMAHEMSHVALRHGTNQASKAYLAQTGLGILGGLMGDKHSNIEQVINVVGGFGLNTLFLKFSRSAEGQADVVGAQMLAKAGYDPTDMVDFFEALRAQEKRDPGKVEKFFSDHPAPKDRAARIRQERKMLTVRPTRPVGNLQKIRSRLQGMSPALSMQQIAQGQGGTPTTQAPTNSGIERPSSQFQVFRQRNQFFQIEYPSNWRIYEPASGKGVTLVPNGGFVDRGDGRPDMICGVIVNHYDPFDEDRFSDRSSGSTTLARATNDLVSELVSTNPHLRPVPDSQQSERLNGAPVLSVVLSGISPVTRQEERITVFTRELPDDHVIYALFIAPGQIYSELSKTFNRMISSLRVNDESAHP